MGKSSRRWAALLLAVTGVVLLFAALHAQQSEALSSHHADGKEILTEVENDAKNRPQNENDEDLSFLDEEEAGERKRLREERLKRLAEEEKVEEKEEDDDVDEDEDDNEGEDFNGDTPLDDGYGSGDEFGEEEEEEEEPKEVDERDVVILSSSNFTDVIKSNSHVLVEFYAPWCGHCQALAPEYAEAATALKDIAVLAKIDATAEDELAQKFDIEGYPTLIFFLDGVHRPYKGQRQKDEIVAWIKKKTGPAVTTLNSKDDAESLVEKEKTTMAIAYFPDLKGLDAEAYGAAARQDDDVVFYQTDKKEVAEVFNFSSEPPALVLLKEEAEKVSWFDGSFQRDEIIQFVAENKLPLVITFNKETSSLIFDSPIKRQFLLFADKSEFERVLPDFKLVSKAFTGKMVFVHVDLSDTEEATQITDFFGIPSDKTAVIGFESKEEGRKFLLEGEVSLENMKKFGEGFLSDQLLPHLKSAPVPETNDGPVKIVVGKNLDDVVLDESTDCFLEIYAPWCGHCQSLEPTWTKLGKRLASVKSIVIAKMDGTANEHARAKPDGFPTLLFYPAGRKSFDPITYDGDRTLKEFVKFLKKEASIPFTVPKRPTMNPDDARTAEITETVASPETQVVKERVVEKTVSEVDSIMSISEPVIIESLKETEPGSITPHSEEESVTGKDTYDTERIQSAVDSIKDEL
ncbi:hypothetical protein R1flu_022261 [Riccia fluitans]|uniref:Protein disulfide-isomerase n=1 Tax=Riccia fluitans TaxID=41844 RepID=A0ABD1ZRP2_9MARC